MWTRELTRHACLEVLEHTHLGRLACVREMRPYVVPIHFDYYDHSLYCFSVLGQKIDWMRANPLVCIEADQLRREYWATVVAFGRYEELSDTPEFRSDRALAFKLLQQRAMWWEHGGAKPMPYVSPSTVPIFYRIKLEQITGRCGAYEAATDTKQAKTESDEQEWLRKLLQRATQA